MEIKLSEDQISIIEALSEEFCNLPDGAYFCVIAQEIEAHDAFQELIGQGDCQGIDGQDIYHAYLEATQDAR
ncbi:hypothetical protein Gekk315_00059 [Aeromonas phage Gekk3-15]